MRAPQRPPGTWRCSVVCVRAGTSHCGNHTPAPLRKEHATLGVAGSRPLEEARGAHRRGVVAQLATPQALHRHGVGVHACAAEQGDRARKHNRLKHHDRVCWPCIWQAVRVRRPTRHA